jgi:hypothetical protein
MVQNIRDGVINCHSRNRPWCLLLGLKEDEEKDDDDDNDDGGGDADDETITQTLPEPRTFRQKPCRNKIHP